MLNEKWAGAPAGGLLITPGTSSSNGLTFWPGGTCQSDTSVCRKHDVKS